MTHFFALRRHVARDDLGISGSHEKTAAASRFFPCATLPLDGRVFFLLQQWLF